MFILLCSYLVPLPQSQNGNKFTLYGIKKFFTYLHFQFLCLHTFPLLSVLCSRKCNGHPFSTLYVKIYSRYVNKNLYRIENCQSNISGNSQFYLYILPSCSFLSHAATLSFTSLILLKSNFCFLSYV